MPFSDLAFSAEPFSAGAVSAAPATAITLSAPGTANVGVPVTVTIGADGPVAADTVVTLVTNSTGSYSVATVTILTGASAPVTQPTYTPTVAATHHLSETNNQSLSNAAGADVVATVAPAVSGAAFSQGAYSSGAFSSGPETIAVGPATAILLSAAATAYVGVALAVDVRADGLVDADTVVTLLTDASGAWSVPTVTIPNGGTAPTVQPTYTPSATGTHHLSATNDNALSNSSTVTLSVLTKSATLTGPSSGASGSASLNFTITLSAPAASLVTFTPSGTQGSHSFSPATPQIGIGGTTVTFQDTAAKNGLHQITITNDGGYTNIGTVGYTTTSAANYDTVDTTIGGQAAKILVPNAVAENTYNALVPTKVIIHFHGSGESEASLTSVVVQAPTIQALIDAGYLVCSSNGHGTNWGNSAAIADYAALATYMSTNYNVHPRGFGFWGKSMGGLSSLLLIAGGSVSCVGWLGTSPVCSLSAAYNGTGGTDFSAFIDTAYGITGTPPNTYAILTAGHDPLLLSSSDYGTIPMRFYASPADTVVGKTQHSDAMHTLVVGTRSESTVVVCSGEHGDASQFQPADTVAFFDRSYVSFKAAFARNSNVMLIG